MDLRQYIFLGPQEQFLGVAIPKGRGQHPRVGQLWVAFVRMRSLADRLVHLVREHREAARRGVGGPVQRGVQVPAQQRCDLGFGSIVISEREVPNMLAIPR
jgi:hypothetical protein